MSFSSSWSLRPCSCAWLRTNAHSSNITGQFTPKFCSSLVVSLNMDFSLRVYKSCCHPVAVMILVIYATLAAFDITVRNWVKNLRSLSWRPWIQAPTWTLCPSLTIQIISLCMPTLHLSWSFVTLSSITCHSSTLLGVTLLAHFQSNACSSLECQIFFGYTIYLASQIASLPGVRKSYTLVC